MNLSNLIAKGELVDVYEDNGKAVKVFKAEMPKNKQKAFNEAMVHATVEATGLPIPKVHGVCEVPEIEGACAIVMDMAQGKTLAQLIKENPAKSDEYLNMMVDLQIDIQSHQVYHIGKLKDKLTRQINRLDDMGEVCKYELLARLAGMPKHTKVCHGDFNPSNVIITPDGTPYVLDWSHATQGNGSADAARTYLLFRLNKQDDVAEKYMKLFCEKTDTARQYVNEWLPIVAASQSVKGKPEEREFLLSWVNVCDYQ